MKLRMQPIVDTVLIKIFKETQFQPRSCVSIFLKVLAIMTSFLYN